MQSKPGYTVCVCVCIAHVTECSWFVISVKSLVHVITQRISSLATIISTDWDTTNPASGLCIVCYSKIVFIHASHVVESNKLCADIVWLSSDHSYWNAFRTMEKRQNTLQMCMAW